MTLLILFLFGKIYNARKNAMAILKKGHNKY